MVERAGGAELIISWQAGSNEPESGDKGTPLSVPQTRPAFLQPIEDALINR
jgi:hypothetical protein